MRVLERRLIDADLRGEREHALRQHRPRGGAGRHPGGGQHEQLVSHTIPVRIFGHEVNVLDLPWLIRVKRAAGRPRDLEAIAELEALWEEGA